MFSPNYVIHLVLSIAASLIAISVHEFSHALAAYKLGDPTAKLMGRLTINPIKHLDPVGTLCMIFFHFGWARPVPIDHRYFKKPREHFALTALAGPLSNIVLAFLVAPVYLLCANLFIRTDNAFLSNLMQNTLYFLFIFHVINIGLGVFNLIPLPPFDGSRIVAVLLPKKWYFKVMKYERYIYYGVIAWLLIGDHIYRALLKLSFISSNAFLSNAVHIFSLSDLISDAISFISEITLKFWQLIPFLS